MPLGFLSKQRITHTQLIQTQCSLSHACVNISSPPGILITAKNRQEFRIRLQKRARRKAEKRVDNLEEDRHNKSVRKTLQPPRETVPLKEDSPQRPIFFPSHKNGVSEWTSLVWVAVEFGKGVPCFYHLNAKKRAFYQGARPHFLEKKTVSRKFQPFEKRRKEAMLHFYAPSTHKKEAVRSCVTKQEDSRSSLNAQIHSLPWNIAAPNWNCHHSLLDLIPYSQMTHTRSKSFRRKVYCFNLSRHSRTDPCPPPFPWTLHSKTFKNLDMSNQEKMYPNFGPLEELILHPCLCQRQNLRHPQSLSWPRSWIRTWSCVAKVSLLNASSLQLIECTKRILTSTWNLNYDFSNRYTRSKHCVPRPASTGRR